MRGGVENSCFLWVGWLEKEEVRERGGVRRVLRFFLNVLIIVIRVWDRGLESFFNGRVFFWNRRSGE